MVRSFLLLSFVLAGCRGGAEARRENERATAEAEQIAESVSETSLTAGTIEVDGLRDEQHAYRERLVTALDALDRAAKSAPAHRGAGHAKVIAGRRETLKQYLDAIDRSTREDWSALKAKIDRDLDRNGRLAE